MKNSQILGAKRMNQVERTFLKISIGYDLEHHIENKVLGPYFMENENIDRSSCKRMLRYFSLLKLQNYRENLMSQQDGALPH